MELLEVEPLGSGEGIGGYLDIKFGRLGKERRSVIDDTGCAALGAKLWRQTRNGVVYSVAYPLLINSLTRRAMNAAAELWVEWVDADVVNTL